MRAPALLYVLQMGMIAAFAFHMPWALMLYCALCVIMVAKLESQRLWRWIRIPVFALGVVLIGMSVGSATSVEAVVGLLLVAVTVKLSELSARRDLYVVLCTDLFALGGLFLLDQGLLTSVFVVVLTLVILRVMMQLSIATQSSGLELRQLSSAALLATPLLVLLFLFFPRLPPIWSVPLSGGQGTTGMSDSMSPGEIANLSQSAELAFRVFFKGEVPARDQLYFRGLVFEEFDGKTWSPGGSDPLIDAASLAQIGVRNWLGADQEASRSTYRVRMEPTNQLWLFALDVAAPVSSDVVVSPRRLLESRDVLAARREFEFERISGPAMGRLRNARFEVLTTLPEGVGVSTRMLAKRMKDKSSSDQDYVRRVLEHFNQEAFFYTLQPQVLSSDRIDGFMFETREGFCEHYASAFTFMMRAAGLPARVVAGYQGGQPGSAGSWEVRQLDAHAWSEVLIDGVWQRVDPTAAVAPERVRLGMEAYTQRRGRSLFGNGAFAAASYGQFQLLSRLQRLGDEAEFFWQQTVVNYDQDKQKNGLFAALGLDTLYKLILWLIGLAAVSLGFVYWWVNRSAVRRTDPFDQSLEVLSRSLRAHGLERAAARGVLEWLAELEAHGSSSAKTLAVWYRDYRYAERSSPPPKALGRLIRQVLRELKAARK